MPLKKADFSALRSVSKDLEGQTFCYGKRKDLFLPLLGAHQLHNAAVVLEVMDALVERGCAITEEAIREGLKSVSWPGRFHIVGREPLFIIDGGHNPQCIEALVQNIKDYLAGRKIIVLAGVLADKDYADMFRPVMPFAETFVCITPDNPRKMASRDLARYLTEVGAKAVGCDTVEEGVALAKELSGKDGVILSFGSLYALGDIHRAAE